MEFSQIEQEIQEQQLHPVYLAYGPETFLSQRLVKQLLSVLQLDDPGMRHLNCQDLTGASAEAIIAACDMPTFTGKPRLVIAREPNIVHRVEDKDEEQWAEYLQEPNRKNVLLIIAEKVDKRRRFFTRVRDSAHAQLVACERPKGQGLRRWIEATFQGHGKRVDPDALRMFAEFDGSLGMLDQEIKKVVTYVGDSDRVTGDDIASVVIIPTEQNIFSLVDAVGKGDARNAVDVLERMLRDGADPLMIFGMVARQIRLIWHVKFEVDRGVSDRNMGKTLSLHPFVLSKCIDQSRNFSMADLQHAMEFLLWTDAGIKRGRWGAEFAVQRLISVLAHSGAQIPVG